MSQTYAPGSSKNIAPEKRPHQNVFTFLIFTFASPHLVTLQKASNEKETPIRFWTNNTSHTTIQNLAFPACSKIFAKSHPQKQVGETYHFKPQWR